MTIHQISPLEAYHRCDPDSFSFKTTQEVEELSHFIGQDRALEAVDFGIGMQQQGFNLFVIGPEGSGRHSVVESFIHDKAAKEFTPSDWCYVHNFRQHHKPLALELPPSQGVVFKGEMYELIDTLKTTIPAVFEGDDYRVRRKAIHELLAQKIEALYHEVEKKAQAESIAVSRTEQGFRFSPTDGKGESLSLEEFRKLPAAMQKRIEETIERLQTTLQEAIHQISIWKRESEEESRRLKKETAKLSVSHLIQTLKEKYKDNEKLGHYLDDVEEDITERVDDFLGDDQEDKHPLILAIGGGQRPTFDQYEVNVLISHHNNHGSPVIYEDLPTYQNLHGRIEHQARMGVLTTNFTLIKPGALHQANNGYLILDARRLLMQPFAYEGLKRTLRASKIHIEPVERLLGLMSTVSLEPEPVDLHIKVVLIGEPLIYYLLNAYDPEFISLFKVQADFESDMKRNKESQDLYATLIARLAKDKGLLPLQRTAVARLIEQATRESGDREKLSLRIRDFADLMQEADYLAKKDNKKTIDASDVERALTAAKRRGGRIKDRFFEAMEHGIRHIDTVGAKAGQINGLSVLVLGRDSFGCPTRITALTRPGKGKIIDIEREVELGGPIHSKGVLILSSFLSSRFARSIPLSLQASLVFEQSYGGVEGDSASCAELCTLLSSLADVPIKQSLAITGSVSQKGEVQAIGGVNEKIEGFFDLCENRGLTGDQGVIIPASNVRHLMLKKEVVDAMAQGIFTVTAVNTVDEAVELLTGMTAGERNNKGKYPKNSINGRVEATLLGFAKTLQDFDKEGKEKGNKDKKR
ncbi:MAG: AAA family ATPase [Proteobacteria bacterium]|nr:AAA family ATPase [Pseudomonadota bacterium]MBU1639901.1 AAA family ATPase [Pseudomonadota bacterium]